MIDVAVIDDPAVAEAALDPARASLLAQLTEPASAAMLAVAAGLPRQKVNYHLRTLERHGLIELVGERRKGNMTERLLQAAAMCVNTTLDAFEKLNPFNDSTNFPFVL